MRNSSASQRKEGGKGRKSPTLSFWAAAVYLRRAVRPSLRDEDRRRSPLKKRGGGPVCFQFPLSPPSSSVSSGEGGEVRIEEKGGGKWLERARSRGGGGGGSAGGRKQGFFLGGGGKGREAGIHSFWAGEKVVEE